MSPSAITWLRCFPDLPTRLCIAWPNSHRPSGPRATSNLYPEIACVPLTFTHDRTFFFASYEGFREVQASTATATVPDALAHQGLLPSSSDPGACTNGAPNGCV